MNLTKSQFFGMYIGQRVSIPLHYTGRPEAVLIGIKRSNEYVYESDYVCTIINEDACNMGIPIDDCKLILRPISAMSEEEMRGCFSKVLDGIIGVSIKNNFFEVALDIPTNISYEIPCDIPFHCIEYLISIGIDVFNLKEKEIAVYEEDLK